MSQSTARMTEIEKIDLVTHYGNTTRAKAIATLKTNNWDVCDSVLILDPPTPEQMKRFMERFMHDRASSPSYKIPPPTMSVLYDGGNIASSPLDFIRWG